MVALALSAVAHILLLGALAIVAGLWSDWNPSKVYVVNLVPTIAAVGSASVQATASPKLATPGEAGARRPPASLPNEKPERVTNAKPAIPKELPLATARAEPPRIPKEPPAPAPRAKAQLPPPTARVEPAEALPAPATRIKPAIPKERAEPPRNLKEPSAPAPGAIKPGLTNELPPLPKPPEPSALPGRPSALPPPGEKGLAPLASVKEPPPLAPPRLSRAEPPPAPPRAEPAPSPAARPVMASASVGSPGGSPAGTASISLDVSDFPFTLYLQQIVRKVSESWKPPAQAAEPGQRTLVLFEIGREGKINDPRVERSSGNAVYDQAALRAVIDASPFPPLPREFPARVLRVHLGFEAPAGRG